MPNGAIMQVNMDPYLLNAIKEDITSEDITTNAILKKKKQGCVQLICKENGIIAGLGVFRRVFELLDTSSHFETNYKDGDSIHNNAVIGTVYGDIHSLLSGERTALNYLQRMSGVATLTRSFVEELGSSQTKILDTRKTTPNMRLFEKYAVKIGGGFNHRYNLSDGILIKDNHIAAAGGVAQAIKLAQAYAPFVRKIEVEVENLKMVEEALESGADIIMLDNMDNKTLKSAVKRIGNRAETECSGNITKERLQELSEIGLNYISIGALTHSAPILDFTLKNLHSVD